MLDRFLAAEPSPLQIAPPAGWDGAEEWRADLASVVRFYQSISPRAPYIAVNTLSLQADRGNSGTVTMVVTLSSLELIAPVK